MATKCTLRCSECMEKFTCSGPWPDKCPRCGVKMAGPKDDTVELPAFLSGNTRRAESVAREMQRGAEFRAQKASEMLGIPMSDVSAMKMNNLRDTPRMGDVAADPPPPSQEFSRFMAQAAPTNAPVGFLNGPQMGGGVASQEVQSGPFPNAGANFMQCLRESHPSYIDPRQQGKVQCDRAALETTAPGYRRRA